MTENHQNTIWLFGDKMTYQCGISGLGSKNRFTAVRLSPQKNDLNIALIRTFIPLALNAMKA